MSNNKRRTTRRQFLEALAKAGGVGAVYSGMATLGLLPVPAAYAGIPRYDATVGAGRSVVILGAGIAGLCAGLLLARAGYSVRIIEANAHIGGRSLTVRRGDSYAERGRDTLTCDFDEGLYLNAGPGRIPNHHTAIIDYCRELKVEMEPFIFASRANLMQSDSFNNGTPVQVRHVKHDIRGQVAEMMAKATDSGALDGQIDGTDRERFLEFLTEFGDLKGGAYEGSERAGFVSPPGAGRSPGKLRRSFDLEEIIDTGFYKNSVYNDMRSFWQASLMQPKGGMDVIVKGFLRAEIPGGKTVHDLVVTSSPVSSVRNTATGVEVIHATGTETADLCVSTMAPGLLAGVQNNFGSDFISALRAVENIAACKVGWQAKHRFWEENDQIFGGISWIDHPISQIWYPSDEFFSATGTMTGAYNRGAPAEAFGRLSHAERVRLALEGGEKLHPGFSNWVHVDRALSIAWHNMPHFNAGWHGYTHTLNPAAYRRMTIPEGNVFLAGDFLSYMPGWKEGSVRSADIAVGYIVGRSG